MNSPKDKKLQALRKSLDIKAKKEATKPLSVRVKLTTLAELDTLCKKHNLNRSTVVESLLEDFVAS